MVIEMKKYTIINTDRSRIYTLDTGNKKLNVHVLSTVARSDTMIAIMDQVSAKYESNTSIYQDDAASNQNAQFTRVALNSLRSEQRIGTQKKKELIKRFENLKQPIPLNQADLVFERDYVRQLTALPFAERAKVLLGPLTVEETSALLRHGDLAKLIGDQPELAREVESAHMVHVAANIIAGDHAHTATLDNPLAVGTDMASARSAAKAKLAEMDAELEAVEASGRVIAEAVSFMAAASDLDAETLFAELAAS